MQCWHQSNKCYRLFYRVQPSNELVLDHNSISLKMDRIRILFVKQFHLNISGKFRWILRINETQNFNTILLSIFNADFLVIKKIDQNNIYAEFQFMLFITVNNNYREHCSLNLNQSNLDWLNQWFAFSLIHQWKHISHCQISQFSLK